MNLANIIKAPGSTLVGVGAATALSVGAASVTGDSAADQIVFWAQILAAILAAVIGALKGPA